MTTFPIKKRNNIALFIDEALPLQWMWQQNRTPSDELLNQEKYQYCPFY